jgi:hypothetical protein
MQLIEITSTLPDFYDDPIMQKHLAILGRCNFETLACPKSLRKELLPAIMARAARARLQLKGRRIQLLKASKSVTT